MRWKVGVAVLVALAVGVGGGWALAATRDDGEDRGPVTAAIEPVPATPSLPVEIAQPDPDDPTLGTGVELADPVDLSTPGDPSYTIELRVPEGWEQGYDGATKWTYTVPGNSPKSYGLRIQVIADQSDSIDSAIRTRIAALKSAVAQGNLGDLETVLFATGDGFTATYTDTEGYDRVSIEQFYSGPEGQAYATVAAYGRFRDRTGLEDLSALVTTSFGVVDQ